MKYIAPKENDRLDYHAGKSRYAYNMLGAHIIIQNEIKMWHFAVWAPNAVEVSLVGDFNNWQINANKMIKQYDGIWELRLPLKVVPEKALYKYAILGCNNETHFKADPYGFFAELRPGTASRTYDMDGFNWQDKEWMRKREKVNLYKSPINIYECHLGSWQRHDDNSLYTYDELADELVAYVKKMGYTHVELLPIMEHPMDMSWGYQIGGYYAATSRFGEPKDLMNLVDEFHKNNIGVILDWVPAHFPRDEFCLRKFDGTHLYEHPDPRRGDMELWGTHMFDFARGEVASFLTSNACFWLEYYHIDGIRVDAVSSMIYCDFSRKDGDWLPNENGGNENFDAIKLLQNLNKIVYRDFPGAMMIAEESTTFPMVTKPTYMGGLGFGFKWNMGWMNDVLKYSSLDPIYRKANHDKLTFSMYYAFTENYILPFSHDEVVHGKHSMLDKMPGDIWKKFAGLRALYGYTMAHPGKKLLFMGSEFAHFIEWKFDDRLDWFLLLYDRHPQMQKFVKDLNMFYKSHSELYEIDDSWDGFQWIVADDRDNSVLAFIRSDCDGNSILAVVNFTPVFHPQYTMGMPENGTLLECFNSDLKKYDGSNQYNEGLIKIENHPYFDFPYSVNICVPPLSCVYFNYKRNNNKNLEAE